MLNPYMMDLYPPQAWQFVMLIPLISCLLLLFAGLVMSVVTSKNDPCMVRKIIHETPHWLLIPAGLGLLMFIGLPWSVMFQFWSLAFMSAFGAPTSSLVVMSILIIGSWILFFGSMFGQTFKKAK